jgi:hypothetical protein
LRRLPEAGKRERKESVQRKEREKDGILKGRMIVLLCYIPFKELLYICTYVVYRGKGRARYRGRVAILRKKFRVVKYEDLQGFMALGLSGLKNSS